MSRLFSLLLFLALVAPVFGQAAGGAPVGVVAGQAGLVGTVDGSTYISPTGAFKMPIPVLPELGGTMADTQNVVSFQDNYNVYITIGAFRQDATQRWELSTRGIKDYLSYFMENFILADFKRADPKMQVEGGVAHFLPANLDGALVTYVLLPGASMFANQFPSLVTPEHAPVAKRGNLAFVKNGFVFVVSTELAERVTEGSIYKKTAGEEDRILRDRLLKIAGTLQFTKPPPEP